MMLPIISLILFAYAAVRLLPGLPLRSSGKLALAALLLLASQFHCISRYLLGSLASPELPKGLLLIQGWLYFALALLVIMLLARDLGRIAMWLGRKARPRGADLDPPADRPKGRSAGRLPIPAHRQALVMAALALLVSAYGVWEAVRAPAPRELEIVLPALPPELDGFTIAHVTDLHASALLRAPRVRTVVDTVMGMDADLILMSGDIVDGTVEARRDDVAPLADLKAAYGVFSCIGNHEYYAEYERWMERFNELGLRMLANSHVALEVNGHTLLLAGTTDPAAERYGLPGPDARAALAGSPPADLRILLEHRPGQAPENAALGFDLQLSGHTHGGHILGFDRVVAAFNKGFVRGLYRAGSMPLYLSSGAGLWNGFPVRLGVPSEVTRITLRAPG